MCRAAVLFGSSERRNLLLPVYLFVQRVMTHAGLVTLLFLGFGHGLKLLSSRSVFFAHTRLS